MSELYFVLVNSFVFFLLTLGVINISNNHKFNDLTNIFFIFLFSLLSIYPYWLFGIESSIGWTDDIDTIPSLIEFNDNKNKDVYLEVLSGGSYLKSRLEWSLLNYQYSNFLLNFFENHKAFFIIRITNTFFTLYGFYFLLKINTERYNMTLDYLYLYASITTFFLIQPYVYGWAIATPFHLAACIWVVVILEKIQGYRRIFFLLTLHALIFSFLGLNVLKIVPSLYIFILFYFVLVNQNIKDFKKYVVYIIFHSTIIVIINFDTFFLIKEFAESKINHQDNIVYSDLKNIFHNFIHLYFFKVFQGIDFYKNHFLLTGNHYPLSIFIISILILSLLFSKSKFCILNSIFFISFIILLFFIELITELVPIKLIKAYKFDYIYNIIIPLLGLSAYFLFNLSKKNKMIKKIIAYILIVINCVSLSNMNLRSLKSNYNDGNWHTKKQFENISFDKNFRSLAINYKPRYINLWANDIQTFGGGRYDNSLEKSLFFNHILTERKKTSFVRHTILDNEIINIKALKIANVRYLFSDKDLNQLNLTNTKDKIKKIEEISLSKQNSFLKNILDFLNYKNKRIYLYEISGAWPKVFVGNKIYVEENLLDKENLKKILNNIKFGEAVLEKKVDNKRLYDEDKLEIKNLIFTKNKIEIKTNSEDGFLILNYEYHKKITVNCNNKVIKTLRVNLIHQIFKVSKDCIEYNVIFY